MMTAAVRSALAGLLMLALAGCASLVTGGPLIRPGEPTGTIQIANASRTTVTVVLISACEVGSYGLNRLPDGVTIPPGRSYNFTVSAGCWDAMVGYGMSNGYAEAHQRMTVRPGGGARFTVTGN